MDEHGAERSGASERRAERSGASEQYIVKPVYKALQLLRSVGESGRELSLGEICTLTSLPKSTAFKYLRTLKACGFVSYDATSDRYRIGPAVVQLGRIADEVAGHQATVRDIALPHMRQLREDFDETVNFAVLAHDDIVYLESIESRRALRMRVSVGDRHPAYSTALGKAMLAHLPGEEWRAYVPARMTARTGHTVRSMKALRDQLERIRNQGYALDDGETDDGISCIAAPLLAAGGRIAGAISISAPSTRITDAVERKIAKSLVATAGEISDRLGSVPRMHSR